MVMATQHTRTVSPTLCWEGVYGERPGVRDQGLSQPCPHSLAVVTLDPALHSLSPKAPSPVPGPLPPWSLTEPTPPHRYLVPDGGPQQSLVDKPLCAFVHEVGARSPAPGGGSVAAASAAMVSARREARGEDRAKGAWPGVPSHMHSTSLAQGAALASMVGLMTYGRRQFEHLDATMRRLIPPFHAASAALTQLVDADARAFQAYLVSARRDHPSLWKP